MRIGFYCESPADQAALAVLAEGILGAPVEPINMPLEAQSVPRFFSSLDGVFRGVHYNSDAEGLVIVVDSDRTALHEADHGDSGETENCRYCRIRKIIIRAQAQLRPREGRPALKVAIGLAVPEIEAWYLVGKEHQVGETAWRIGLEAGKVPLTKAKLKELVYGTDRPSLERETEYGLKEARRLVGSIKAIEDAFPVGFGLMARDLRSWRQS